MVLKVERDDYNFIFWLKIWQPLFIIVIEKIEYDEHNKNFDDIIWNIFITKLQTLLSLIKLSSINGFYQ